VGFLFVQKLAGGHHEKVLEYERRAAECRQIAAATNISRYEKQLEEMAEVWERLAAERRRGIVENEPDSR
jgi:hypothetical protein